MTTRVERSFDIDAPPERVWAFIADPGNRANAISVVDSWETEGDETVWHVRLPIPFVKQTVSIRTRDVERVEGERVRFVGTSSALRVQGDHELVPTADGTRLENRFVVDGKIPGVERFFERNLGDELENLRRALVEDLGSEV